MKRDRTRPPPDDWPLEHPWLYIYTVLTTMLLSLLATGYLRDWIKALLP